MDDEVWKDVVGYEGLYEVSSLGRVRRLAAMVKGPHGSIQSCPACLLSPNNAGPYPMVRLCRDAKKKNARVHTLVLNAFVGPRPDDMEARHFPDRDRSNNKLSNLRWGTKVENAAQE